MGLFLRCKHNWFAAADQMLRQGAAEVASADDGCRHGFKKLHQMKLSLWSTGMGAVNDRMQIGAGTHGWS
jgi:hypothetical protein